TWSRTGEQPVVKTKGIRKGAKMFGAIEFFGGKFEYRESLIYSIRPKSLKLLKEEKMEIELLKKLKPLKNLEYQTLKSFLEDLNKTLGPENTQKYETQILKATETSGRFNGNSYIQFLQQLLQKFNSKIILIEDGASYHRESSVNDFKEKNKNRLTIVRFPTFSPELNPIEKLWKNTKRDATHLKYFQSFEDLRTAVIQTFEGYMNEASKVLTVMKKLRIQAGLV
ncbi:transposase, partial [Deltaproteobacteria bacterium TL4]